MPQITTMPGQQSRSIGVTPLAGVMGWGVMGAGRHGGGWEELALSPQLC